MKCPKIRNIRPYPNEPKDFVWCPVQKSDALPELANEAIPYVKGVSK